MKGRKPKASTSKNADSKLAVKKGADKATKRTEKKVKGGKDPNKPKRPPSAFFVFMEGFRKQFKEKNPNNKLVSVVGKAGGQKWKSMSETEKAPFVAKAEKLKAEYQKKLTAYDKGQEDDGVENGKMDEEESDKSNSEVNDEEDDGSASEEEGEEDD